MKFEKFTAENGYFTLMLKLCLNSIFLLEIRVGYSIFSMINTKSIVQVIFSIILYKEVSNFELIYTYNSYKYSFSK